MIYYNCYIYMCEYTVVTFIYINIYVFSWQVLLFYLLKYSLKHLNVQLYFYLFMKNGLCKYIYYIMLLIVIKSFSPFDSCFFVTLIWKAYTCIIHSMWLCHKIYITFIYYTSLFIKIVRMNYHHIFLKANYKRFCIPSQLLIFQRMY